MADIIALIFILNKLAFSGLSIYLHYLSLTSNVFYGLLSWTPILFKGESFPSAEVY